jgi:hypothetical protein
MAGGFDCETRRTVLEREELPKVCAPMYRLHDEHAALPVLND